MTHTDTYLLVGRDGDPILLPTSDVVELVARQSITSVPGGPPFLAGVLNLRGHVLPVVDLALKLGGAATTVSPTACVVVVSVPVEGELTLVGLLVSEVDDLIALTDEAIVPSPAFGASLDPEYLHGLFAIDEQRFAAVLDIASILSTNEIIAARTAGGASAA